MPSRSPPCGHFDGLTRVAPRSAVCEDCAAEGGKWNELRVCLTCGHVGCCEDSPHAHAFGHFRATGHPVIASLDRREDWTWCYEHARYYDLPDSLRPSSPPVGRSLLARLFGR